MLIKGKMIIQPITHCVHSDTIHLSGKGEDLEIMYDHLHFQPKTEARKGQLVADNAEPTPLTQAAQTKV